MSTDRRSPDGGDAEWDEITQEQPAQPDAEATDVEALLTDAALPPDDPIAGEAVRRGADPDMAGEAGRGEEP
jgi:hypothetical protein